MDWRDNTFNSLPPIMLDRHPGSTADSSGGLMMDIVATLQGRDLTICRRICSLGLLRDLNNRHGSADLARQDGFNANVVEI